MVVEGSCVAVSVLERRVRVSAIETKPEFERTSAASIMEAGGREREGQIRETRRVMEMRSGQAAIHGASSVSARARACVISVKVEDRVLFQLEGGESS